MKQNIPLIDFTGLKMGFQNKKQEDAINTSLLAIKKSLNEIDVKIKSLEERVKRLERS